MLFRSLETLLGQGTIGLELEEQLPELDTLLVAVGGGGCGAEGTTEESRRVVVVPDVNGSVRREPVARDGDGRPAAEVGAGHPEGDRERGLGDTRSADAFWGEGQDLRVEICLLMALSPDYKTLAVKKITTVNVLPGQGPDGDRENRFYRNTKNPRL